MIQILKVRIVRICFYLMNSLFFIFILTYICSILDVYVLTIQQYFFFSRILLRCAASFLVILIILGKR